LSTDITRPKCRFARVQWGGVLGEQENSIYLSVQLIKILGLKPGNTILFRTGSLRRAVTVSPVQCSGSASSQPVIFISPDLNDIPRFPVAAGLVLKYCETDGILSAGPLIGLLTVRNIFPESQFGSQEPLLTALVNSAPGIYGFIYVFCPEDIDWDMSCITGYVPAPDPDPESGAPVWVPLRMPMPDVIYDRIPTRSAEARPEVTEAKTGLAVRLGIPYFNPMFLDKWETHQILEKCPEVACYLPPTRLVETPDHIRHYLDFYGSVFLKPSSGSLGRRIINIRTIGAGHYKFRYRSRERETVEGIVCDFKALVDVLKPVMGKKTFIVQKDLHLAEYEDCPFDIRVLAQKDKWGNWRRTKIYVRKADTGNFLSNISDGGKALPISTVLEKVFNTDFRARDGLGEEIRRVIQLIPSALEKGTGLTWGELGLDLGIDREGKVWLIEINSKPFRVLVSKNSTSKIIERSLMRPLEFAKLLAGFYRHHGDLIP